MAAHCKDLARRNPEGKPRREEHAKPEPAANECAISPQPNLILGLNCNNRPQTPGVDTGLEHICHFLK